MTNSYVISRLCDWARYSLRGIDGGVGFKKQTSFANQLPQSGDVDYTPDVDEASIEMDRCVNALIATRPDLYEVIYYHYLRGDMKFDDKLKAVKCGQKTFYNRANAAHNLILGWLNDLAAGISIPTKTETDKKIA